MWRLIVFLLVLMPVFILACILLAPSHFPIPQRTTAISNEPTPHLNIQPPTIQAIGLPPIVEAKPSLIPSSTTPLIPSPGPHGPTPRQSLISPSKPSPTKSYFPEMNSALPATTLPTRVPVVEKTQAKEIQNPIDAISVVIQPDKGGNYSNKTFRLVVNGEELLWPEYLKFLSNTVANAKPDKFSVFDTYNDKLVNYTPKKLCDIPVHFVIHKEMPIRYLQFAYVACTSTNLHIFYFAASDKPNEEFSIYAGAAGTKKHRDNRFISVLCSDDNPTCWKFNPSIVNSKDELENILKSIRDLNYKSKGAHTAPPFNALHNALFLFVDSYPDLKSDMFLTTLAIAKKLGIFTDLRGPNIPAEFWPKPHPCAAEPKQ